MSFAWPFGLSDPGLAQRVTSQLAYQCEGSVNQAPSREDRVLLGLSDEIKKAEADLAKQEEKIKDFNLRFLGGHLEKQTATLAALNRLILQLQSNADLLNGLQEQKSSQERALTQPERQPVIAARQRASRLQNSSGPANCRFFSAIEPFKSHIR